MMTKRLQNTALTTLLLDGGKASEYKNCKTQKNHIGFHHDFRGRNKLSVATVFLSNLILPSIFLVVMLTNFLQINKDFLQNLSDYSVLFWKVCYLQQRPRSNHTEDFNGSNFLLL